MFWFVFVLTINYRFLLVLTWSQLDINLFNVVLADTFVLLYCVSLA